MDYSDGLVPTFYIGHHEANRQLPVTEQVFQHALDCNVE